MSSPPEVETDPSATPVVPRSMADIDVNTMTPDEVSKWGTIKWVWCTVCAGGSICKSGWSHKSRRGHECLSLKDAGKVEEAKREFLFLQRGGPSAARALVTEKQAVEPQEVSTAIVPKNPQPVLEFGMHKGRKLSDMLASTDQRKKEYIPWLLASASQTARGKYLDDLEAANAAPACSGARRG